MDDFEKAEFWEALGRLYNTCVALKDAAEAQARTTDDLVRTARQHENRLDGAEIYIQAMLDDARRDRLAYARMGETARQSLETAQAVEKRLEQLLEELRRNRETGNGGASEDKG